jgi:aspartyl-tRNA(Asn)/glutamyl-tRNA(Gln) amidotransferase subunit C
MPSLSRSEVEHIAKLAKLELSEEELGLYTEQLGRVLEHFSSMAALDTTGVPPTVSPRHLEETLGHGLRADEPRPSLDRDEALGEAPEAADGYFRVPRMSDEDP